MKAIEKYNKIVKELIRKSFPELKNLSIRLKVEKLKRGSMRATRLYGGWLIIIDPEKYSDAKNEEIVGAMAHELCHFEDYLKKSWIKYFFWYLHYKLSNKFRRKVEIKTDIETIKRGYGKELAENRGYMIKKYPIVYIKGVGRCYLLPKEIKQFMRKYKKEIEENFCRSFKYALINK